jgi:lactose/cellobiose-specific phosphotransferase system IIC component
MKSFSSTVDKLLRFNHVLEENIILTSVRRGLTQMVPLLLIGSFALVFISLPIPDYQQFMANIFGTTWAFFFNAIRNGTFDILSIFMVVFISYAYIVELNARKSGFQINPIIAAGVSLCSFVIICGLSKDGFSVLNFGTVNIFEAILASVISVLLFSKLCAMRIFKVKSYSDGANKLFNDAIVSIFPAALTIVSFALFRQLLSCVFHVEDLRELMSLLFSDIFRHLNSSFWSAILFVFLVHLLWFFGIHGSNVLEPVAQSIFVSAMSVNTYLAVHGFSPTQIVTKTFIDNFVLLGGCGSTLALILAILVAARHKNIRRLVKISSVPVLFNINETMTFGLPVVLNPVFLIPFIGIPILLTCVSYLAMYLGFVPYTTHTVEWTIPVFLSGYASTGSIAGSILQAFNLLLATICYIPFVQLSEKLNDIQMKNNLKKLYKMLDEYSNDTKITNFLARHDDIGNLARFIANDLEHDFKKNQLAVFYQPQVGDHGNILGAEALLRWKHNVFGYMYPPLAIALAEESSIVSRIGDWTIE